MQAVWHVDTQVLVLVLFLAFGDWTQGFDTELYPHPSLLKIIFV